MSKLDELKGAVKEEAGKLTGDKELQAKGFAEKVIAKGKELAEDAKDAVEGAKDAVEGAIDSIKEKL